METIIISKPFSMEYNGPHMLASTALPWSNKTVRNVPVDIFSEISTEHAEIAAHNQVATLEKSKG